MIKILFSCLILLYALVYAGAANPLANRPDRGHKKTIKILSYNVRNCAGLDRKTDYNRIAQVIRRIDADVVAIQELDSATTRSKGIVALNELAEKTGMLASYSASIDFQGGKYGVGVLTREKPVSWQKVALPGKEERRSLLLVELKDFVICCTHLSLTREDRMTSVQIIQEVTSKFSKPVFLAGDLNTEPGSAELKLLETKWTMLNSPSGLTFPADIPNKCIDFILVRKDNDSHTDLLNSGVEAETVASDHRPVWVQLTFDKGK